MHVFNSKSHNPQTEKNKEVNYVVIKLWCVVIKLWYVVIEL